MLPYYYTTIYIYINCRITVRKRVMLHAVCMHACARLPELFFRMRLDARARAPFQEFRLHGNVEYARECVCTCVRACVRVCACAHVCRARASSRATVTCVRTDQRCECANIYTHTHATNTRSSGVRPLGILHMQNGWK